MSNVFNPVPPPICEKCGKPMGFTKLANGKWRPCNPDGSDHWDLCRDIRYAKAKAGQCREESWTDEHGTEHRIVWWDGGAKPFLILQSSKRKGQVAPSRNGGLIPIEQHRAHAAKHGYTVIER